MEFLTSFNTTAPRNLYPCLATITVFPPGDHSVKSRKLSVGSFGSGKGGDEDENALKRIVSGGRRKSSFGAAAGGNSVEDKRKSLTDDGSGKWYWRVQVGATNNQLVLLPLTQPPNPLLNHPPQPLSQAMPAHSTQASQARSSMPGGPSPTTHAHPNDSAVADDNEGGFGTKIKNLFRRGSASSPEKHAISPPFNAEQSNETMSQATSTTATAVDDRVIDQTVRGEMAPTAEANRFGATNLNANAETTWPGTIDGEKLGAVIVDLRAVEKGKVTVGGGKKGHASWVIVPITSHFGNLAQPMLEPLGRTHHEVPKSGTIRFDFDKDWIGAKGEAELLHHHITMAIQNLPAQADSTSHTDRAIPESTNFRLSSGQGLGGSGVGGAGVAGAQPLAAFGREVAPEEKAQV